MNAKSKTVPLCHTMPEQSDESYCSCAKCDSYDCFSLKNREQCRCNKCKGSRFCLFSKKRNLALAKSKSRTNSNCNVKLPEADSTIKEEVKNEITYKHCNNNNTSTHKIPSKYSYFNADPREKPIDDTKKILSSERVAQVHSAQVVYSRKNFDSSTAKLSAQIMNVPYNDFKQSISYSKSVLTPPNSVKLAKFDIFRRIKDIYKACSCKVCECIAGKSAMRSANCKCEPCNCKDCISFMRSLKHEEKVKQMMEDGPIGCPCIRCNRSECKGLMKKTEGPVQYCDCDCLQSLDNLTKPCNCQPCECIECTAYAVPAPTKLNTFIVASISDGNPCSRCQCSPCDCAECGQDYPMPSSLRHEMSTSINRPVNCTCDNCLNQTCESNDNNTCSCDIQRRVVRKPFEKDTRDYDIHRALMKNNGIIDNKIRCDTIAMYAAIKNNYPKFELNKQLCSCVDCECLVCSCKEHTVTSIKASRCFQQFETESCKCSPCECEICNKHNLISNQSNLNESALCKCSVCECLNCKGTLQPSSNCPKDNGTYFQNNANLNSCKCSLCECNDCQKKLYKRKCNINHYTNCKCEMCTYKAKCINESANKIGNNDSLLYTYGIENLFDQLKPKQNFKSYVNSDKPNYLFNLPTVKLLDITPVKDESKNFISKRSQLFNQERVHLNTSNVTNSYLKMQNVDNNIRNESLMAQKDTIENKKKIVKKEVGAVTTLTGNRSLETETINNNIMKLSRTISHCLNELIKMKCEYNNKHLLFDVTKQIYSQSKEIEPNNNSSGNEANAVNTKQQQNTLSTFTGKSISDYIKNDTHNKYQDIKESINYLKANNKAQNPGVPNMSLGILMSLRIANERLSKLIQPQLSQCKRYDVSTKLTDENGDLSTPNIKSRDVEIDYIKLKNTLQQADAFADGLINVLNEYKKENFNFSNNVYKQISHDGSYEHKSDIIDLMPNLNGFKEKSSICSSKFNKFVNKIHENTMGNYDAMKRNGTHNMNIIKPNLLTNEETQQDTENDQYFGTSGNDAKYTEINERNNAEPDVDDIQTGTQNVPSLSNNVPTTSNDDGVDEDVQSLERSLNQSSEERHKCRSIKRTIKDGKKFRVPRSIVLYKRVKLREALIKLATKMDADVSPSSTTNSLRSRLSPEVTLDRNHNYFKTDCVTTSTSIHRKEDVSNMNLAYATSKELNGEEQDKTWSILKKNWCFSSMDKQNRGFALIPPLQLEVKDMLRAMSSLHRDIVLNESNDEDKITSKEFNELKDLKIRPSAELTKYKAGNDMRNNKLDLKYFNVASSQTSNFTNNVEKAVDCMDATFSVVMHFLDSL